MHSFTIRSIHTQGKKKQKKKQKKNSKVYPQNFTEKNSTPIKLMHISIVSNSILSVGLSEFDNVLKADVEVSLKISLLEILYSSAISLNVYATCHLDKDIL